MEEVFEELKNVLLPNSTGKSEVNPNYGFSSNGWNPVITEREVYGQLRKLNQHKSSGSDFIPNKIYSFLSDLIAGPLSHIFGSSLQLGIK